MTIHYRLFNDPVDFEKITDLEILVWGLDPRDAVPGNILHAITENGGVLVAAEQDQQVVGLCLGLPARRGREWYLWSHMAGVHPAYQGQGIGLALKQHQRQWATEQGYSHIRWTYDPLQAGNARFNIHHLRATANIYHLNYYGEMTDSINAGLPSDRLEVIWTCKKLPAKSAVQKLDFEETHDQFLVSAAVDGQPEVADLRLDQDHTYVEIPYDLRALKHTSTELALAWRLAVRAALQQAFERGYTIVDFLTQNQRCAYVLAPPTPWFLYVVECHDGSFYTGIAKNVERRLQQHNAGKGAAYTVSRRPVTLLAVWRFADHGSALRAEAAFKKQTRQVKLASIHDAGALKGAVRVYP